MNLTRLPDLDCDGGEICRADVDMDGYAANIVDGAGGRGCDDDGEADAMAPGGDCDDTNLTCVRAARTSAPVASMATATAARFATWTATATAWPLRVR